MIDAQPRCVQREALDRGAVRRELSCNPPRRAAVPRVDDERRADRAKMHANLVLSTGARRGAHARHVAPVRVEIQRWTPDRLAVERARLTDERGAHLAFARAVQRDGDATAARR